MWVVFLLLPFVIGYIMYLASRVKYKKNEKLPRSRLERYVFDSNDVFNYTEDVKSL